MQFITMQEIFNQVEELVGTYPTGENLRSAVHAIITKNLIYSHPLFRVQSPSLSSAEVKKVSDYSIMNNVEYIARNYESTQGRI